MQVDKIQIIFLSNREPVRSHQALGLKLSQRHFKSLLTPRLFLQKLNWEYVVNMGASRCYTNRSWPYILLYIHWTIMERKIDQVFG